VFFLCLTLILGKRRRELDEAGAAHRPSLAGYSPGLVDQMITVCAGLTAVVFLLFLSQDTAAVSPRGAALLSLAPLGCSACSGTCSSWRCAGWAVTRPGRCCATG